jgi:hypothetical protein
MVNFVHNEFRDDVCGLNGFLRMTSVKFNELLEMITPEIQRQDTARLHLTQEQFAKRSPTLSFIILIVELLPKRFKLFKH